MDRLPEEIIANIIAYLVDDHPGADDLENRRGFVPAYFPTRGLRLAPYATISRRWQQCIEPYTFAYIAFSAERLASPLAAQALSPNRIRRFVRFVHVDVELPPFDEAVRNRPESDGDKAAHDALFTDIICKVFAILSRGTSAHDVPGETDLQPGSVAPDYRPKIHLSLFGRCVSDAQRARPPERHDSSFLAFRLEDLKSPQDKSDALPELKCVVKFRVFATLFELSRRRHFAPGSLCYLASRMTGLREIKWLLSDEKRDMELKRKLREDFANGLQKLPPTLRQFDVIYERDEPRDHLFEPTSIVKQDGRDKLSIAFYELSRRLEYFALVADVSLEIFGLSENPEGTEHSRGSTSTPSSWPMMQHYSLHPGTITPSGQWRFRGPQGAMPVDSDDEEESELDIETNPMQEPSVLQPYPGYERYRIFRGELDIDLGKPLLLGFARAAARMPALRRMELWLTSPSGQRAGELKVVYTSAHECGLRGKFPPDTAELVVVSEPDFYLDEEVMQAWKETAKEHTGAETRVAVHRERHEAMEDLMQEPMWFL